MLVISRKVGQGFHIGDDVKITVVEIKGSRARIAIEAPAHVPIWREEIALELERPVGNDALAV